MDKHFVTPKIPFPLTVGLIVIFLIELVVYGLASAIPLMAVTLIIAAFYVSYMAIFRRDALPLIFALLFFTAYHSLLFNANRDLPIALLFLGIFIVNSAIMWLLLHYATHLKPEYHWAYSLISGFMIAQIITLFASMVRDWPFRFELASYMPTVFSYVFWRFACLSAESMLGWKQFIRLVAVVCVLILVIILGSPNVQV